MGTRERDNPVAVTDAVAAAAVVVLMMTAGVVADHRWESIGQAFLPIMPSGLRTKGEAVPTSSPPCFRCKTVPCVRVQCI